MLIKGIKLSPVVDGINLAIEGENLAILNKSLDHVGQHKINIWFEAQLRDDDDTVHTTLCIHPAECHKTIALIAEIAPEVSISTIASLNIVSIFPFRDNPEAAHLLFRALEERSIPVLAASTSLSSLSCLIHHEHCSIVHESLKQIFRTSL